MIATANRQEKTSDRVEVTLRQLRRNNVRQGMIYSLTVAAAWLCVLMVSAISLDWAFGWLSAGTRWLISLSAWSVVALAFASLMGWVLRSRRRRSELAQQADTAAPAFEERIQTIVTIEGSDRITADRQMMQQVMQETETIYARIDPAEIAQRYRFGRPIAVIGGCLVILCVMLALQTRSTAVLMSRFLWPSTSLTRTVLTGEFGDQVVAENEPWRLRGALSGATVSTVLLEQRMDPAQTVLRELETAGDSGDQLQFTLARAKDSFDYRLTAGDYRSDWMSVTVARRPRIVGAELHVVPPKYTGRKETRVTKIPRKLNVIAGSQLTLSIRAEGDIEQAEWLLNPDKGTRTMYRDEDGFFRCTMQIQESVKLSPRLVEPHGLENLNRFEIAIRAIEDKPPTVRITKPSPDTAVRPDDTIRIEFDARDDVGIGRADVVLYKTDQVTGEVTELKMIPVSVAKQRDKRRLEAVVEVDLSELGVEHGETINYRVDVYDQKQLGGTYENEEDNQPAGDNRQGSSQSGQQNVDQSAQSSPSSNESSKGSESSENQDGQPSGDASDEAQDNDSQNNDGNERESQGDSESDSDSRNGGSQSDSMSNSQSGASESDSSQNSGGSQSSGEGEKEDASDEPDSEEDESSDEGSVTVDESERAASAGEMNEKAEASDSKSGGEGSNSESDQDSASDSQKNDRENLDQPPSESEQQNGGGQSNSSKNSNSQSQNQSSQSSSSSKPNEDEPQSSEQRTPDGGRRPTMRSLDAAKPSSSGEMQLKIDQYAGSFEGEARRKLEIAIDPVLQNLNKWLTATEDLLAAVGKDSAKTPDWNEGRQQSLERAIGYLEKSTDAVDALNAKTKGTPYAFVGLQIAEISLTHLDPATSDALAALKTTSDGRYTLIDSSRGQVQRALARLKELTEKYEREKRDQLLAERIQEFQKMYRVFIEDTLTRLQAERQRINSIKRKGVEFDLDEEYLARLKEVLEMRRDLEAELARILSEDPRLLKRFSQSSRGNADTLRDQFTLLARRQYKLTEIAGTLRPSDEEESSGVVAEAIRAMHPGGGIELRTLEVAYRLTGEFGDALDRFDTWMPLNDDVEVTPEMQAAFGGFREASSRAERLRQSVLRQAQALNKGEPDYDECATAADAFVSTLADLRQDLITLGTKTGNDEISSNATNRLVEIGRVRDKILAWRFQIDALAKGRQGEALAVDQHQLMIDLHDYADKMSTLPGQIAGLLPEGDGTVPETIATLADQLLSKIDTGIEPTQLASVLALRKEDLTKAQQRMASADTQFREAEEIFDQLMIEIVKVLDELPVNDPIASLLDDPTLEEILSSLERELPLNELLGIPNRPSNLQVINDWATPNSGGGGGGGGGGQGGQGGSNSSSGSQSVADMVQNAMQAEQQRRQSGLRELRRVLVEVEIEDDEALEGEFADDDNRWNKVISQLGDGLIQQQGGGIPERYRTAIQQYFETISSTSVQN